MPQRRGREVQSCLWRQERAAPGSVGTLTREKKPTEPLTWTIHLLCTIRTVFSSGSSRKCSSRSTVRCLQMKEQIYVKTQDKATGTWSLTKNVIEMTGSASTCWLSCCNRPISTISLMPLRFSLTVRGKNLNLQDAFQRKPHIA